ncbi:MAG: MG2 domain-containing protein [Bacteroidia bacterium]|nr:MG2 domain-containing protein [Bacteroidia bacterium]
MQPHKIVLISALTTMLLVIGSGRAGNKSDNTYEQLWQEARQLSEKQLPQSALQVINRLYDKAAAESNQQQMLRALIFSFSLRESFEDGVLKNAIGQTLQLAEKSAFPVREIAHSMLAEMYWFHYRNNRHRILDRSATGSPTSDDPDEWDATRFRDQILFHYQQSLRNQAQLEAVSAKDWDILLENNEATSIDLQPTLFDFLAGRYLNFLSSSDAALQSRIPLAEALPESVWQPAALFVTVELPKQDHETLLRLRLYQRVLTSNIRLGNSFALIHNELQRFKWLNEITKNDKACWEALSSLQSQYAANPASAEVAADRAEFLRSGKNPDNFALPLAEALKICDQTISRHPASRGAQRCEVIKREILDKDLSIEVQRVEFPETPIAAELTYRNITKAYFRIAPVSSKKLTQITQEYDYNQRIKGLLSLKASNEWYQEMPFEPDYSHHSGIIALPALKPGLYVLMASDNKDFKPDSLIVYVQFQVSRMSYLQVNRQGINTFVLLDRQTGQPVGGATVKASIREYDYKLQKTAEKTVLELVTPKNGQFSIGPDDKRLPRNRSFYLEISRDGDTLMSDNYFDVFRITEHDRTQRRSWFFTDRAIYRPGQPLYFKGITLVKESSGKWMPEQQKTTTVKLFDANGRETASLDLKTNDFGSFEGSFVIPLNLLTGNFRLSNEQGMTFVQVEEYKRPTFEVNIQLPENQVLLGESVTLKATAKAFAGYPIDGAKVEYRIERQQYFPWWPWWRPFPMPEVKQLIKQSNTTTSSDGSFNIQFDALPDYAQAQDDEQYYDFVINAWVTDRNGEVRQGSMNLRIGNRSLQLSGNIPESLNRRKTDKPQISLTTVLGKPAAAQTTLNFYRIEPRKKVVRPAIFETPDRKLLDDNTLNTLFPNDDFYTHPSPDSLQKSLVFTTQMLVNGKAPALPEAASQWPEGDYLAEYISTDQAGKPVKLQQRFTLYDPAARRIPAANVFWAKLEADSVRLGDTINLLLASSQRGMRAMVEISSNDKVFQRKWMTIGNRKQNLKLVVGPEHIGSLSIQVTGIALNRHFHKVFDLRIADPEQLMDLKLETLAERLQPGKPERWTVRISGIDNRPLRAELLAAMYDASLEQFKPHRWNFDPIPTPPFAQRWMSDNGFGTFDSWVLSEAEMPDINIPPLEAPGLEWYGFGFRPVFYGAISTKGLRQSQPAMAVDMGNVISDQSAEAGSPEEIPQNNKADAARNLRSDFRETAFFYPQLTTDSLGRVSFSFIPPDALTRWRLMLLAHTTGLQHAYRTYDFESSKPLIVAPNLARFYRLGDTAVIVCKVVNTGSETLDGMAMLELSDALSDAAGGQLNDAARKPFVQLRPGQSTEVRWRVTLNNPSSLLRFRISASAGTFTDAEEHLVPLLPSGIRLTETLPMFVKGNSKGTFVLPGLEKPSPKEQNLQLKLEITTHPAWVAVKALPYVVDAGFENTDNIFRRFYTNTMADKVAGSIPNFAAVLASWNQPGSKALESELSKNQDVKMLAIEQTPWLSEAESETAQRRRLTLFFDRNRIALEKEESITKLAGLQLPDGSWPWFPGMRGNLWITQSILEGIGKLRQLDAALAQNATLNNMVQRAMEYSDRQVVELYAKWKEKDALNSIHLQLLSTRSYFPLIPQSDEVAKAYAHFQKLLEKDWNKLGISDQAEASLHLQRIGNKKLAQQITASLRERAVRSDKLGIWWKAGRPGDEALSIETHALLVQVFELVAGDRATADGIRQYLLSQKQTRRWVSGPATAEAVYALLMYGSDWVSPGQAVEVVVGAKAVKPTSVEAGTGYFSTVWAGSDITPAMARTEISNPNAGMVWGGLYRNIEVPVDAVRPSTNEVKLSREIMVERTGPSGVIIESWRSQSLRPGDRIKVRMVLETSRDLEFIHLTDLRSPAFEPVEVLSGYQWRNGLGFYQSTRDASTDFFFDFLPRGKHVFEYSLTVMQSGWFSGGFARMQSYYAPSFSAHSAGTRVKVD